MIKKVLVLGSGGIQIGQAGEFDYSGSQALKALKEEGIETVLINPNIATIQTDEKIAGKVYFLPLKTEYIENVIKKEKPDGILLGFGGQTGLNCGVQLNDNGVLKKYNVKVLGTSIDSIKKAEDRKEFKKIIEGAGLKTPKSGGTYSVEEAKEIASQIGYPVIVRVAYTLGGKGSGVAKNKEELEQVAKIGLSQSMIKQILVEEYLDKWKEIEYEVMRDKDDNCITICNMENFDPMGIHTGDSIVVAPSQTLTNHEYHKLREISIKVIKLLGIVGECNIQFALNSKSDDYRIIEVNPRLSRSSALASKATGYPIAYLAAKLSLGYTMPEIKNKITGVTYSCFEPSLDYIVVKIPRWDFEKFEGVSKKIGVQMKSVGEVMSIGRSFEEALQKAIRMIDKGYEGICDFSENPNKYKIIDKLSKPTDSRIFYIVKALESGMDVDHVHNLTGIDSWFLLKIKNIVETKNELQKNVLTKDILLKAKKQGFSDKEISKIKNLEESYVRKLRKKYKIIPVVKQIDTLAAEWPAKTNYLYLTYNGSKDDINFKKKQKLVVLGSGVYRIGSSVEFDWCCVNAAWSLKSKGVEEVIMINYNPETVSTDYDVLDKLYFEELSLERILDIWEKESPEGVIVSVGGQIPNNLSVDLDKNGVKILGTSVKSIDNAENRSKFSKLLDELEIKQPPWKELKDEKDVLDFCKNIGYPVIVRPSYVLSGKWMKIILNENELINYFNGYDVSEKNILTVSKFIENAKEVDVDGVSDGQNVFIGGILEHIENAGVHSGDATMVIPTISLNNKVIELMKEYTKKIVLNLEIKGPFNVQYLVKGDEVLVIECNLRSSRSMPFVSKTIGVNLMDLSVDAILGKKIKIPEVKPHQYGVKSPQFSYFRLDGSEPISGVEMNSTGEVACFGDSFEEAFKLSITASGFKFPEKNQYISIISNCMNDKSFIKLLEKLSENYKILLNGEGYQKLKNNKNIEHLNLEEIEKLLDSKKIGLVINIPYNQNKQEYLIRRKVVEYDIPLITNLQITKVLLETIIGN